MLIIHCQPFLESNFMHCRPWWHGGSILHSYSTSFCKAASQLCVMMRRESWAERESHLQAPVLQLPTGKIGAHTRTQAFINKCFIKENNNVAALQAHAVQDTGRQ